MIIETIKIKEMGLFPELFLGLAIIYLIMHGLFVFFNSRNKFPLIQTSMINLSVLTLFMACFLLFNDSLVVIDYVSFSNTIANDYLSFSSKILIGITSIICLLFIQQYIVAQKINQFEYIVIILFAILGLFLLCSSNDLITAYLAIELQSLSFYILAAFKKDSTYSVESGLKYFILGAFSSGLFLFGSSLIYGITGSVNFEDFKDLFFWVFPGTVVADNFQSQIDLVNIGKESFDTSLLQFALIFILISLFFKLALAPFHVWSPDIYEGSPTSSTFFFAVVPKLSIFILLLRICHYSFYGFIDSWRYYVVIIAIFSIIVGSVAGLEQRKLKSLLAYSSISHMGYLLISFSTGSIEGVQMLFAYLLIYMVSGLAVWSVFVLTRLKTTHVKKQNKDLADLMLLRKSNSMLALILTTALFSIAGLPPMVGFMVKIGIFLSAVETSMYFVALASILFSVISTFYYIRIVKVLYFEPVLVGRLYYPINTQKAFILVLIFYLFIFLFINPTLLYLFSYKISLMF